MTVKVFKLCVCIPSGFEVKTDFALSLTHLCLHMSRTAVPGYTQTTLITANKRSSVLPALRESLIEDALRNECTHALFVDSDQCFPPDTVHRLAAHHKPVVGANIALKCLPSQPSARNSYTERKPVYSNGKTGLERVKYLGFGVTLLHLGIFARMQRPWFAFSWAKDVGHIGEDITFFDQLDKLGVPVYVDHDLSLQVGHCGDFMYTHEDIEVPLLKETCRGDV